MSAVRSKMRKFKRFIFTTNSAIWWERSLDRTEAEYTPAVMPVMVDFDATRETVKWIRGFDMGWMLYPAELAAARRYGHCFACARRGTDIVGYIKIGLNRIYIADFGREMDVPEGSAFVYDTFVDPRERGKGIARAMIAASASWLRARGILRVGCHIPVWNTSSIHAYQSMGFSPVCSIRFVRLCGKTIFLRKEAPSWVMQ